MTKWIAALMMSGLTLAAAPPDPAAVKEVLAANDALKQAMMKKDTAGVAKYLHDDLIYEHSHGQNQTKADVVNATKGTTTIEAIDFSEVNVRVYGNTALIKANCDMRNKSAGKEAVTTHLNVLLVWLKGPGGWQLLSRQSTLLTPTP
jgi:ketosteroid isomerase-like protein